jgi:predicted short-subunit dehydrogenase-like oxidoreductase (DUF2520 family)
MSDRLFILGAGRAGRSLAHAFRAAGVEITGLHGRHASPSEQMTAGPLPESLGTASCVLVTVRDAQLDSALADLADAALRPGAAVLHASGSSDPEGLARLRALGHPCGTFHPLLALSSPANAPQMLRGAWIGIDGDAEAQQIGSRLARALGANVLPIPPGEKARYHAAAVFASNFPTVLMCLAEELLREVDIDPVVARQALHPLFASAVDNLRSGSGASVLTGPIVRGDAATVERHIEALRAHPDALDAYRALSHAALRWVRASRDRADGASLDEIERVLAGGSRSEREGEYPLPSP